jgi:hypothetical protein
MKKTITAMALLAGAVSAHSQGQVQMYDYGSAFAIQVFATSTGGSTSYTYNGFTSAGEVIGNTSANDNAGSQTYSGAPLGAGYDVCLLGGPAGTALANLTVCAGSTVTAWAPNGVGSAGYWNTSTNLATIAGTSTTATVAVAAWIATGVDGAAPTLLAAQQDGYAWGVSPTGVTGPLGFNSIQPPVLPAGVTSFSLGATPEPSTIALGVIGASAFLMRLRRKQ